MARLIMLLLCSADEFFRSVSTMVLPRPSQQALCLSNGTPIIMSTIRQAMDLCLEKLPNLLKYDTEEVVPLGKLTPRVFSQLRALSQYSEASSVSSVVGSERLSESMGYVLQKVS